MEHVVDEGARRAATFTAAGAVRMVPQRGARLDPSSEAGDGALAV
ncbi:hypothetical protein [Nannocystis punicea]|uniref:Uncharacterized protein n=1 Tax=Nannocystis punicea TaxID=2995304 RepID=A0ABY7GZX6_9BACT|nr:hypothetical protein [Nannocystis poenicansa]WAS92410.1 hypothetical protein O0S08_40035 [Nannocystis poenicansa]